MTLDRREIFALRRQGLTFDKIAAQLGCTRNVVAGACRRAGLSLSASQVASARRARDLRILEALARGERAKDIAARETVHAHTVSDAKIRLGLRQRKPSIGPAGRRQRDATIVAQLAAGATMLAISRALGVCVLTVSRTVRRLEQSGVLTAGRWLRPERRAETPAQAVASRGLERRTSHDEGRMGDDGRVAP